MIAWIEGTPIGEIASFPELDDARCREAYKLFEAKLRKVIT
ncbi:hypothetical protein [Candidatus Reidiella endopervernicosa]|nr:hypothetical protein [Candidatus Reidiella endopervernicosa]